MSNLTLAVLICPLAGTALKLTDTLSERENNRVLCLLTSGMSGFLFGSLISFDTFSSAVFSGILIGVVLAGKVDRPCLVFGLIMTLLTAWLLGLKKPALILLIVSTIASFLDEIGHDRYPRGRILSRLFEYRFILKLTIILSCLLGVIPLYSSGMFFLFDLSYDLSSRVLETQG